MLARCLFILSILLLPLSANAQHYMPPPARHINHVIYITLDGTRWQDIMVKDGYFSKLWSKHAPGMSIYGMPGDPDNIEVASTPISLPSYQSQMSGQIQPCKDNRCGRIHVETLPEYLIYTLRLRKQDVATFSSWPTIADAVESRKGTTYTNTGNKSVVDPITNEPDDVMKEYNKKQKKHHSSNDTRYDKYTFAQAMHYLETYKPTFLWISLNDADELAHKDDKHDYHKTLAAYDDDLDTLFTTLASLQMEKDTLVIITTDHGRGDGHHWTSHGPEYPESKTTWAFVMNGTLEPDMQNNDGYQYSTLSIRPTIERALWDSRRV